MLQLLGRRAARHAPLLRALAAADAAGAAAGAAPPAAAAARRRPPAERVKGDTISPTPKIKE